MTLLEELLGEELIEEARHFQYVVARTIAAAVALIEPIIDELTWPLEGG